MTVTGGVGSVLLESYKEATEREKKREREREQRF